MKKILLAVSLGCAFFSVSAQLKTPAASPTQTINQDFGLASIELSYSRPGVKSRKIFGDVRPFGVLWRTGANGATTLTFGDDVTIGGTLIKAGKYGLLTIPDKESWVIIISKQLDVTSPDAYKKEEDVVRVVVKPIAMKDKTETFTMQFANVKPASCDLYMLWENTAIILPITTDIDTKVMAQIKSLPQDDKFPYFSAASYYLDNGKDLSQALVWFNKALDQNASPFYMLYQKAVCQSKLGKKEDAKATALKSIEASKLAKNDDYVVLNEKLIASLK